MSEIEKAVLKAVDSGKPKPRYRHPEAVTAIVSAQPEQEEKPAETPAPQTEQGVKPTEAYNHYEAGLYRNNCELRAEVRIWKTAAYVSWSAFGVLFAVLLIAAVGSME